MGLAVTSSAAGLVDLFCGRVSIFQNPHRPIVYSGARFVSSFRFSNVNRRGGFLIEVALLPIIILLTTVTICSSGYPNVILQDDYPVLTKWDTSHPRCTGQCRQDPMTVMANLLSSYMDRQGQLAGTHDLEILSAGPPKTNPPHRADDVRNMTRAEALLGCQITFDKLEIMSISFHRSSMEWISNRTAAHHFITSSL